MNLAIDMYRENILENYKNPKNFGEIKNPTHKASSINKSCGDEITISLVIKENKLTDIKFTGKACAICTASASLLTEEAKNKKIDEIKKYDKDFSLSLLEIPISAVRIKCALLPLETLQKAILNNGK
ncbi:iron-sulfur cluster assembly scaffold protein [Candidatus Pacearchaeota archaeon]|nr:iron-sulfur cluster assembly scaffold protein [Candidatus Pacearchaeota archaeon]